MDWRGAFFWDHGVWVDPGGPWRDEAGVFPAQARPGRRRLGCASASCGRLSKKTPKVRPVRRRGWGQSRGSREQVQGSFLWTL